MNLPKILAVFYKDLEALFLAKITLKNNITIERSGIMYPSLH